MPESSKQDGWPSHLNVGIESNLRTNFPAKMPTVRNHNQTVCNTPNGVERVNNAVAK